MKRSPFINIIYQNDKDTINPSWDDLSARFHYNFLENAIIKELKKYESVLDIGPGYGHWIKFYQEVYGSYVNFIEISQKMTEILEKKYNVVGYRKPIERTVIDRKYDVINAIGVLHHIIKKKNLVKAIQNITDMLNPDGTLFIGTRVDFIKPPNEGMRLFRTLDQWSELLSDYDITIQRSDPPWHCRKHLDLITAKYK